ncbi:hypothetical protein MLD38_026183 [Melastoma candidum]|uniref:Uncharacterized protein n=1 Tax=Melastoma candidum TaxID=119954 RepID=A0ACB9NXP2_9MYRT|nr:hypothetical protein MLD38_026183 [Melastoma candidum]
MVREEDGDVKVKHVCRFCDKSFPSGRQLGGHMRSHQNHNNLISEPEGIAGEKIRRKKIRVRIKKMEKGLDPGENFECRVELGHGGRRGAYVLRENPRKSWRIAADESSEDVSSDRDKSCRECRRGFGSWKALFGHMKRHALGDWDSRTSDDRREIAVPAVGEEDSWSGDEDEEEVAVPRRMRRSGRRKGYMVAAASSSSLSPVNNNEDGNEGGHNHNLASSVSEIDQEQEEVAMCLMMLSKDVGQWKVSDSIVATPSKAKMPWPDAKKVSGSIGNSVSDNLDAKYEEVEFQSRVDRRRDRKRPWSSSSDLNDFEQGMKTQKEFATGKVGLGFISGIWVNSDKRTRFECSTCNKVFRSYQALGGHKASHSKIKDCFPAKIDGNDNSIEIHTSRASNNVPGTIERRTNGIVGKKHECPVCLKVFPSGQALGGHKRSHMQQGSSAVLNVRDAFDLNLPAQMEDEGSSHVTFSSWGAGSSRHSQEEPLAGL